MDTINCKAISIYLNLSPFVLIPNEPLIAIAGGNEVMYKAGCILDAIVNKKANNTDMAITGILS